MSNIESKQYTIDDHITVTINNTHVYATKKTGKVKVTYCATIGDIADIINDYADYISVDVDGKQSNVYVEYTKHDDCTVVSINWYDAYISNPININIDVLCDNDDEYQSLCSKYNVASEFVNGVLELNDE